MYLHIYNIFTKWEKSEDKNSIFGQSWLKPATFCQWCNGVLLKEDVSSSIVMDQTQSGLPMIS